MASKIILVTGGNNGIGYEIVKALLESAKSYHVIMGSRSLDRAKVAMDLLEKEVPQTKNTVEAIQVDVTSDESINKAFEQVKNKQGHIDTLVNNAGKNLHGAMTPRWFENLHLVGAAFDPQFIGGKISLRESFTKAYDVNLAGTHVMTWAFVPLLLKSSDPRLIFVAGLSNITQAGREYFPTPPQPAGWVSYHDPKELNSVTRPFRSSGEIASWNDRSFFYLGN
jgi:NAD(P)-dependent dehydrogenase (short-subunit alcohol dehydrogenase family)